jgi:putative redox protein
MRTISVHLRGGELRLEAMTESGHEVVLDDAAGDAGPRPSELLLVSLAGCTALDVISILRKKRQSFERYSVSASGTQREEHPTAFTRIVITHRVEGEADPAAVRRAIELSATRYCSVGATLSSGLTEIRHCYELARDGETVAADLVVVTGPYRSLEPSTPVLVEAS